VHRDVARAFVHHLNVLRPRALGQLALRVKLGELRLIVRVSNTARPQAVADGKLTSYAAMISQISSQWV
jgi:hypothetical protein